MHPIAKYSFSRAFLISWQDIKATIKFGTILLVCAFLISSCAENKPDDTSQEVTKLEVDKSARELRLYNGSRVIRTMDIGLGFNPVGHKFREGDGKTPQGRYYIDRKNPYSSFHLSLGISYPNANDRRKAWNKGYSPGGDIMIHGLPNNGSIPKQRDWTRGCIAVTNAEIEYLYKVVDVGTPIIISE